MCPFCVPIHKKKRKKKASFPQIAEFFLFLCQDLSLSVPTVKGYRVTLNHVFSLIEMDLAASTVVSRMFRSFKRLCSLREIRPLDWNLSLVLRCLSRPRIEPLKLASDIHLPGRRTFYLLLHRPRGLVSCTAFRFVFVTLTVGDPVASPFFLTSWLRPRILPFLTLALSSWFCPLTNLLVVIEMNYCSAPSEPFVST